MLTWNDNERPGWFRSWREAARYFGPIGFVSLAMWIGMLALLWLEVL